jgi:hypothetical protein
MTSDVVEVNYHFCSVSCNTEGNCASSVLLLPWTHKTVHHLFNLCCYTQHTILCKQKLLHSWDPLKVTTHNVWICCMNRLQHSGGTVHSLIREILLSAVSPRSTVTAYKAQELNFNKVSIFVFWKVTPCSVLGSYKTVLCTCCLHLQSRIGTCLAQEIVNNIHYSWLVQWVPIYTSTWILYQPHLWGELQGKFTRKENKGNTPYSEVGNTAKKVVSALSIVKSSTQLRIKT